ncbi:30S ribosomal protein S11 [Cerasicoccus frondis]|uniref:30S ribosomal protein S11 n=1 Tax=Cerasicoccus frondis TaxID=490090 RepID=UPI0031B81700
MSEEEQKKAAEAAVATKDEEAPAAVEGEASAEGEEEKKSGQPSAKDLLTEDLGIGKIRKAKGSKNIHSGVVHILATFNNTKVTFTDTNGNVISWSSAGKMNFRGSRKSTAYAAQVVTQDAGKVALSHGMKEVSVKVKGPGMGRDSAIRALQSLGLIVTGITDATPVPHNGCRPPKRRRV